MSACPASNPEPSLPLPRAELRRASRVLDALERRGNRLPDPAVLFVLLAAVVVVLSAALATLTFSEIGPRARSSS